MFVSPYYPVGKASQEKFSQLDKVNGMLLLFFHVVPVKTSFVSYIPASGYVPQVRVLGFTFPLLMCDIDEIDLGMIGWKDPEQSYDMNNMFFDIPSMREYKKKLLIERLRTIADNDAENKDKDDPLRKKEENSSEGNNDMDTDKDRKQQESKDGNKDDGKVAAEGNNQKKRSLMDRFKTLLSSNNAKLQNGSDIIENPCFHIIKHWEPPVDPKDAIPSKTVRFEAWGFREKMLMGKQE